MSPEKAIYDLFVQGDNLSTAMEMSKFIEQFEGDMHKHFWSNFNIYLDQKIKSSDAAPNWKFVPFNTRRVRSGWEKSCIRYRAIGETDQSSLQLVFGQAGREGSFPLFWGVNWNGQPKTIYSPSLVTLSSSLITVGINIPEAPIWVYWGWYKYRIYEASFLVRCYSQTEELVQEIINNVWDLFSNIRPYLENINQEVMSKE